MADRWPMGADRLHPWGARGEGNQMVVDNLMEELENATRR